MHSRESIAKAQQGGERFKFVFFWGDKPRRPGIVDQSCLSQWYRSPFSLDGQEFQTAEHAMMFGKASLFGDGSAMDRIRMAKHPGEAKSIGREVMRFDQGVWEAARMEIVMRANLCKFQQNPDLGSFLMGTGNRILVEASPRDNVWGIGLTANDRMASNASQWPGQNLLGFALMEVRGRIGV